MHFHYSRVYINFKNCLQWGYKSLLVICQLYAYGVNVIRMNAQSGHDKFQRIPIHIQCQDSHTLIVQSFAKPRSLFLYGKRIDAFYRPTLISKEGAYALIMNTKYVNLMINPMPFLSPVLLIKPILTRNCHRKVCARPEKVNARLLFKVWRRRCNDRL